jgi:hypothetical protein
MSTSPITAHLLHGTNSIPSYGQFDNLIFGSTWAAGDTWLIEFVASNGSFTVGRAVGADGTPILVGTKPTFGLTLGGRVYLANVARFNFCDNNDPTGWHKQNPGAGFISVLSQYGGQDAITSLASYQGMLAAFLSQSIQIWQTNADPSAFQLKQVLANVGTRYGFSVQSLGDWDVLFLADSGVRSLRVRDSSLNAVTTDIGSPIDSLIQGVLGTGVVGVPVSTIEPTTNRYWLFLKDTIYVLSLFSDAKIRAWSTYKPTVSVVGTTVNGALIDDSYSYTVKPGTAYKWTNPDGNPLVGAAIYTDGETFVATSTPLLSDTVGVLTSVDQQPFTPLKFVIYNGMVYCRATAGLNVSPIADYLVSYGVGYDDCVATVKSPYLSLMSPSTNKYAKGIDLVTTGTWAISVSMDPVSKTFEAVAQTDGPTFDGGVVPLQVAGTHAAFMLSTPVGRFEYALLSSFALVYDTGELQ